MIPRFNNDADGTRILSSIVWSTQRLHRSVESDVNFCRAVWKHLPRAKIWYEEFCPGFWMINYSRTAHGEMGVFGND